MMLSEKHGRVKCEVRLLGSCNLAEITPPAIAAPRALVPDPALEAGLWIA